MPVTKKSFPGVNELPSLKNLDYLVGASADNGVSDIIDMTGGSLLKENKDLQSELKSINFVNVMLA